MWLIARRQTYSLKYLYVGPKRLTIFIQADLLRWIKQVLYVKKDIIVGLRALRARVFYWLIVVKITCVPSFFQGTLSCRKVPRFDWRVSDCNTPQRYALYCDGLRALIQKSKKKVFNQKNAVYRIGQGMLPYDWLEPRVVNTTEFECLMFLVHFFWHL